MSRWVKVSRNDGAVNESQSIVSIGSAGRTLALGLLREWVGEKCAMRMILTRTVFMLAWAVMLARAAGAAGNDKLSPELKNRTDATVVEVVVQFSHVLDAADEAAVVKHGGTKTEDLTVIHALLVTIPANRVEGLSEEPTVKFISPNRRVKE